MHPLAATALSLLVDGQDHEARSRVIATAGKIVAMLLSSLPMEAPSVTDAGTTAQYRVLRWLWLAEDLYIARRLLVTQEAPPSVELSVSTTGGAAAQFQALAQHLALVLEPTTVDAARQSVVRITVTFNDGAR